MSSLLLQSRSEELEMGYASRDLNQRPGISAKRFSDLPVEVRAVGL